jgi:hypothetical protein
MIASQMGNTKYRGRIIWMLLTSRPDLLPIDLKRQGRAEVHIPLFYPDDSDEITEMIRVMARKNRSPLADDAIPEISADRNLSGADLESILPGARRKAMAEERATIERADLQFAFDNFIPSAQGLEKEMQELVAVLECTDQTFLPDEWREKVSQPNGRVLLQERLVAIRRLIDENGRRFHYAKQRDLARTLTSRALLGMVVRYLHRSHFQFQAVAHVICEHSVQVFIGQLVSGQTIMEIVILVPEWISQ